jgi:CheY-like chemotaxis protein
LVEDDPDIRSVAAMALEAIGGHLVHACESGAQAVAAAPGFAPDLVLLDVMMPEMDGPATLRALRELPEMAQTPVIFLTAKAQPQEVARYRSLGALGVVAKPFDPMTLSGQIRKILDESDG